MRPLQATQVAALLLLLAVTAGCQADSVLGPIQTTYGNYKFNGEVVNLEALNYSKVIQRFLGVPYAHPPTENRRFASPSPLDFNNDVTVDATHQPALCPQDNSTKGLPYSEDCLYMNIWTPSANGTDKYAVLVYIHGGRFETGGIAEPENQGETLLRNQDLVFVSIAYRLGVTGFLFLDPTEMPGNFGLLDQRQALKTIVEIIGDFGGDQNRITLAGHGTGSASVGFHIASASIPIHRAVMMGGSHFMPLAWSSDINAVRRISESFVNVQLNCAKEENKLAEVIDCVRTNVSIETIVEEQKAYEKLYTTLEFMPVLDREFFNLLDPLMSWGERRKNVTILMGVTAASGIEFALNSLRSRNLTTDILTRPVYYEILRQQFRHYPRFPTQLDDTGLKFLQLSHTEWNDADNKELLLKKWAEALGDFSYLCPTLYALFDEDRPQPGEDMNSFLYYFGAPDPLRDDDAPGHVNDLRYFLGIPDGPGPAYPDEHNKLSKRMMADLGNFVRDGAPNSHWPSVIAGNWNFNNYLTKDDSSLYNVTGGFAIRRCRWWFDTLSYVNRLAPAHAGNAQFPLPRDPFSLDGSTLDKAAPSSLSQQSPKIASQPATSQVEGPAEVNLQEVNAKITGHRIKVTDSGREMERFLGVPYAQPPTGDQRFRKPTKFPINDRRE